MLPLLMDKFALKDPSTAHCRIYIGNLPNQTSQEDIYEIFKKHGTVVGILLNKGFGFLQYEDESGAQEAIQKENGYVHLGRNLIVRTAVANIDKSKQGGDLNKPESINASSDNIKNQENSQGIESGSGNSFEKESGKDNNSRHESDNKGPPERGNRGGGGFNNQPWNRGGGGGGMRGGRNWPPRDAPPPNFRERSPVGRGQDWRDRAGFDRYASEKPFVPDRNDCEIIVVSKALTEYAEYIEDRLKRHGITVDLLFPKEDVPIGRVLGNIHSRGCLYAILIMPQNEEHRSLTLNILHGIPQEHRHMPIEDALNLMSRNYAEYRSGVVQAGSREAVLALLGQLADGRSLTVLQYDRVIEYLKEKREAQVKMELGDAAEPSKEAAQNDLQQIILSMLNETPSRPAPIQNTEKVSDPSIQKALDSFLQKLA